MEYLTHTEIIEGTKKTINDYKKALEMTKRVICSHNYVIVVGAYTIGKDHATKRLKYNLQSTSPSKWNENGVAEIKRVLKGAGEKREIEVYLVRDYFNHQIERFTDFLDMQYRLLKKSA